MDHIIFLPDLLTGLVRGMALQDGEAWDEIFADDIMNHLFEKTKNDKASAMDLIALNIQRGRDHGISGYNAYREACGKGSGIEKATTFDDLRSNMRPGTLFE